jgi:hypothetical protein
LPWIDFQRTFQELLPCWPQCVQMAAFPAPSKL